MLSARRDIGYGIKYHDCFCGKQIKCGKKHECNDDCSNMKAHSTSKHHSSFNYETHDWVRIPYIDNSHYQCAECGTIEMAIENKLVYRGIGKPDSKEIWKCEGGYDAGKDARD